MKKIFIDGSAGTTGLRIRDRLSVRKDIDLLEISDELRKDASARKEMLNSADIVFLCLPDDAAREAVDMVENPETAVIDTSTAHRTSEGWAYGFPELEGRRSEIAKSKRIANPGCHASGFIALVEPLVAAGIIAKDALLTCFSLTGYTGGGKKMIADYQSDSRSPLLDAPRQYALTQSHKHLAEMQKICALDNAPCFCPIVADFPCGMEVTVPLFAKQINGGMAEIEATYRQVYTGSVVKYVSDGEAGFLSACAYSGRDGMGVSVYGNGERIVLVARFDNLGKGASGAAIQNMNILLTADECEGLII